MYLEKLELIGFKSFANRTKLEFPKPGASCPWVKGSSNKGKNHQITTNDCGIVAIVGPNGSGKSNVADSVRWVLGEQSMKIIRSRASEDVIFSGSDKKGKLGMAEVSMFINNEDKALDIDYPEVVITRRFYRNGDSEYLINHKKARLSDIVMLVAKANFGQKSYSVIGQGMIDTILNILPQERKDFFDEAVGVKSYQIKRDQSLRKLENAFSNLNQAETILAEITPRLNSLTRQVKRLERREEVENKLLNLQRSHFAYLWSKLVDSDNNLRPNFDKYQKQVKEKEVAVKEIQNKLNELEKQESRSEEFTRFQKQYQKVLEQKNKLIEQKISLENQTKVAHGDSISRVIKLSSNDIINSLKEIESFKDQFFNELESIKNINELSDFKKHLRELFARVGELIKSIQGKPKEEKQEVAAPKIEKEFNKIVRDLDILDAELASINNKMSNFNKEQDKKKDDFFELQRLFQKKQNEYNEVHSRLNQVQIELAKIETKKEDLEQEIAEELKDTAWLKSYVAPKLHDVDQASQEIQRLKHQLELIGSIDPEIIKEYKQTKERHDFLKYQSQDLKQSINNLETVIDELDRTIHQQFSAGFKNINQEFQKYFKILFDGGRAELILLKEEQTEQTVDESEIANQNNGVLPTELIKEDKTLKRIREKSRKLIKGIDIYATPPGKKLKGISMLSGGERALTSIALICSIISNNPSPFVVLDEVDAALDEANSERFAAILEELAHKTQFIIITHNRATMHKANILYGVTMGDDGISKMLSLKMEEAEKMTN